MMSLHTWGRDLSRHPHLHCLVTAGGVDADGQWKSTKPNQLVPFEALHKLYRGKVLAALRDALKSGQLQLPKCIDKDSFTKQLGPLYAKHWNVRIEPQYQHGEGLTVYLARYAKGGPLPQERELRMQDGQVQFEYTSHRDQRLRTLRLGVPQFIERMLWHAPPRAVHTTRHSGLYSTPYRKQHALARTSLSTAPKPAPWPRPDPSKPQSQSRRNPDVPNAGQRCTGYCCSAQRSGAASAARKDQQFPKQRSRTRQPRPVHQPESMQACAVHHGDVQPVVQADT